MRFPKSISVATHQPADPMPRASPPLQTQAPPSALDHFNLHVTRGEIFGLLGPNGSGKTTSINCVLALLAYDRGTIQLFGEPMGPTRYDHKRRIGVVPQ